MKTNFQEIIRRIHDQEICLYSNQNDDQFIIADSQELYNVGTSINHAGHGVFLAQKEKEEWILESLLKILSK